MGFKWDLGWDLGLEWDYDKWDGMMGFGMDLGWDGSWDSPIPINMGGKYI